MLVERQYFVVFLVAICGQAESGIVPQQSANSVTQNL